MAPDGARGVGQKEPNWPVDMNQGLATDLFAVARLTFSNCQLVNVIRNTVRSTEYSYV